ncbi:hexokinase [Pelosinus sp. sgz500959]|uniref:hexokinase n=1 Tax=Pelosinus sp. sgz500959 TaxID=3242472 RepID=UPI00366C7FDB
MSHLLTQLQALTIELSISSGQINIIADCFCQTMIDGLLGKYSPLKMLPSYLNKPSRDERGTFLALDFGGTNVRVLLTELFGNGIFKVHARVSSPLRAIDDHYNYISNHSTGDQLFDFIAMQIGMIVKQDQTYPLGHTFSFPTHQTSLNTGTLIDWTKEIETQNVVGHDVTTLLTAALTRQQLTNVLPKAIINDTVGTLLTSAYTDPTTTIGSICGTGHNTAYIEPCEPLTKQSMIINLESGNFDQLPFTIYDKILDDHSEKPGSQRLEKMVSGHYIGEQVRIIACSLFDAGLLAACSNKKILAKPYLLSGAHISLLQEDTSENLDVINNWLIEDLDIKNSTLSDRQALKTIAALVCTRSARLVAATYLGIIKHIDPQLKNSHNIAIDGSLYEKMPGYASALRETLAEALGQKVINVTTTLTKDGSGIGAAIATAIAVHVTK